MTDIESPDTLATQIVDHVDFCADSPLNPSREIAALIRARDLAIRADERAKALLDAADAICALETGRESTDANIGEEIGLSRAACAVRALLPAPPTDDERKDVPRG